MQYFGYLRRDPDQGGYDFWLNVLENREPNNYRGMVCSFITSAEYQQRFGNTVTRINQDCSQYTLAVRTETHRCYHLENSSFTIRALPNEQH